MIDDESFKAYGVFKPVGHVLASFADDATAREAAEAFVAAGFAQADVHAIPAARFAREAADDIANAGVLASIGQELNLAKAHLELAERGHGFVLVRADDDEAAQRIAGIARRFGADRAQSYGRFIIEELVEPGSGEKQVAESPARGLDAQTPSGRERA